MGAPVNSRAAPCTASLGGVRPASQAAAACTAGLRGVRPAGQAAAACTAGLRSVRPSVRAAAACVLAAAALAVSEAAPAHAQRVTLAPASVRDVWAQPSDIGLGTAGDAELDYVLHCQGCHRADGGGTPGAVPQLADHVAVFLRSAAGREYLARVPGVAMSTLDDAALAALLNWLVVRFDPRGVPAGFVPYTAAEVARLRQSPLVRVTETRAALLRDDRPNP
ncbi:MAG TPA: hypothetical protein VEC57_04670 [Candidatus Limnocylindrales bacterium]|nr:hypothetical protein [Candidatus Limnocylindrales bacterium]